MILDINNICTKMEPELATFIHNIITIIKVAVPVILVIFGMLDFGKGVVASKEDEIKKGQSTFIKRVLAGIIVFFIVTITQLLISVIDKKSDGEIWACADAIMNGKIHSYKEIQGYDEGKDKETQAVSRKCNGDINAEQEYNKCIQYQGQKICDTIFQEKCNVDKNNILWKIDNLTDMDFVDELTEDYTCNNEMGELYQRALYSCGVGSGDGQTLWDLKTCVRYMHPFCSTTYKNNDSKKNECCYKAGGIMNGSGECVGYSDASTANKNGKAQKKEVNMESYNKCMNE